MKLSCLQENLDRGLSVVGRAVPSRSTLPITQNVLLKTDEGMLTMAGTNLDLSITTSIGAMIEEEGAITVPYRLLADLIKSLPSDRVDLELRGTNGNGDGDGDDDAAGPDGNVLHIKCGRSRTHINGAAADNFPRLPEYSTEAGVRTRIEGTVLRRAIRMTAFCAATDEARPVLTGVELRMQEKKLVLAAADGFRLGVYTTYLDRPLSDDDESEFRAIVPAKSLLEVFRLAEGGGRIGVVFGDGKVIFKTDSAELVSQLLQGTFPNYEQLIPDRYETRSVVNVAELKRAVQSASVFARDGSNIVRLEMEPVEDSAGGKLKVSARSEEVGDNSDELDIEQLDGTEAKIAFNARYLQDVIGVLANHADLAVELTTSSSPGVFREANQEGYIHVVMPMYVQW